MFAPCSCSICFTEWRRTTWPISWPIAAGELVHPSRALDEATVHVDESARDRERVDLVAVHDVEVPDPGPPRDVSFAIESPSTLT